MSRQAGTVYCNGCGRRLCREGAPEQVDFLTIEKEWGYFSKNKDGQMHRLDLCEECYDRLVQQLFIAPESEEVTELF